MLPEHAPFTSDQRHALDSLFAGFNPVQRGWLSGFLAASGAPAVAAPVALGKLMVLYGTESGNCEVLADRALKAAKKRGFQAVMKNMSEISPAELAKSSKLLVIVSTWGDGAPPETAVSFVKELMSADMDLSNLKFSVCGLGDTAYEKFCQVGKDIDARLEGLGAQRIFGRQDCDVDYEDAFAAWLDGSLSALAPLSATPVAHSAVPAFSSAVEYGKKNPFPAETIDTVLLNGERSSKETLHLEFSLATAGFSYEPGDALAVIPVNAPDTVREILRAAKLEGNEEVEVKNVGRKPLAEALREDYDITALSRAVLTKLAEAGDSAALRELLTDDAKERLKEFTKGREIIDALLEFAPTGLTAAALTGIFRKLPPRLY